MDLDKGTWKRAAIFVIAACVVIGTVHSEIIKDSTSCSRTKCKVPASRKFKYEEGVQYRYRYSVNVSTNLGSESLSSPRNESTLYLDAYVVVHFTSPCEGNLRFYDARLGHEPGERIADAEFNPNLARYNLRFAFDDGRIDELCPHKHEPAWALNLKRGVLSMLQNNMRRFDVDHRIEELDVNGLCETNYRLHEARHTSLVVKKSKNLSNCAYGSKHFSVIQSNMYRSPKSYPSRYPLVESRSDCELIIDHNVYEQVVCKDLHRLQPLSSGKTGARTESTAELRLLKETKDNYSNEYGNEAEEEDEEEEDVQMDRARRTTLLYDYSKTAKNAYWERRSARDLLRTMCRLGVGAEELQHRFSETFTAFIHSARLLDYPWLSQLFARANTYCKTGKKHIVDALPFIGSNAAVSVMKDLIMEKYVDQKMVNDWVTAFALIPRPNQETIKALSPLLDFQQQIPDAQFVLSYSATIHAFCTNYGTSCSDVQPVSQFLTYLEQKIQKGCMPQPHSPSAIKDTMEALKAIGNMGLETDSLLGSLKQCIDESSGFVPMEIRVAAVEAHRRMQSCEKTRDLFFLDYYRNFTLNAEIRIASYLQVIRCPDYNVIKTIKHTLKTEEFNQVGTFVWSHLTNLYRSASPTKVEVQSLLTDDDLGNKFNGDRRKFSRNYDGSFFSEEYNVGANYQGNLIFSPDSYIPRSATFNVTFDLFSESVNVFELTTRFEGLEYYAEKFFGPDGPYSNEKVSGFFKTLLRTVRQAPEEEDDYWKRVKKLPNVIENNFDNPRISLSYKVFGNDLKYSVLNGDKEIREALMRLNPWEKFKQMASGKEIHYENAAMFLDSTYVVPMASGLPVRLDFTGSVACNFTISGLLDSKGISNNNIEIVSNIMPSVSVNVVGSMAVDAFYTTAGVKLRSNVYLSGGVQLHLDVKGLRSVQLSLGLPNKKMEVFSIGTDILFTSGNAEKYEEKPLGVLIAGQNDNSKKTVVPANVISNTTCSWTALDRLVGLKLCVDYQLSNVTKDPNAPYFVLSGPTLFKISLLKADPTAKNYVLEYKWNKTEKQNVFRAAFDTPGSQVNRELSATVSFDRTSHNVTVVLRSAGNSIMAEGTYKSTENETFIDISFDINGTKHFDASLGYTTKNFSYGYTFSPEMHLIVNNERIAALTGTIRNAWKNDVLQCDVDLFYRTKRIWSKLVGYVVKRNASLASDFQLDYQMQKMPRKETLRFEISLANRSSKTLTYKSADMKLHSTAYPQLNSVVTAWYQQALGHLELHAEVNSKPHLMDDRHKLTIQLILSYSKMYFRNQDTKFSALIAITKPIQNLDIRLGLKHYAMGPESKSSLLIGYAPGKEVVLTVNLLMPRGLMFAMEGHANLSIPNFKSMLMDVRITERSKRFYDLEFREISFTGYNVTAKGTYADKSVTSTMNHSLKLILKSPTFASDILLQCKLYRNYNDFSLIVSVEQVERDKYAFILNHTVKSPTNFVSYIEGRYKGNVYWVMANVNSEGSRLTEIQMDVHLDKWRDIRLELTGANVENKKRFGAMVKWDANRDPMQKLGITFSFEKTVPVLTEDGFPSKNISTELTFIYPGRFITSFCLLSLRRDYNYVVDAGIDWDPDRVNKIGLFIATQYDVTPDTRLMMVEGHFLTPFENWRKTALSAKYLREQSNIKLSGSAHWKDSQVLKAEFDGSTSEHDRVKEWKANCAISSSIHSITWVIMNVTHKIVESQVADTRLLVKYNPDKVIEAWSIWFLDKKSDSVFNLTGNLHLESPVTSYKKTDMKCQLQILPDWKFLGMANLDLDKRTYTTRLIGDVRRIKESMVQFNVTTPLEKLSFVRGRFGLSESNRHAVAEVVIPSGPIGVEALAQFFTSEYDCNVKLSLATPLELLQRILLIAKLNNREADFRAAYNNMTAGFQGVWHYRNITDFHYTYLLFTPVSELEEIGMVAKLIVATTDEGKLDVDTEFSIRLVEVQLGVRAKAGPKPPPVSIPIKPPISVTNDSQIEDEKSPDYLEEYEEDTSLYWHGEMELHPAIVEPVVAELDIDHEGPNYKIYGHLDCFSRRILLDDTFYLEDLFNMKNELSIVTPFAFANEIVCVNAFLMDMETPSCTMQLAVNIRRNEVWHESGMNLYYTYNESETDDSQTRFLKVDFKTPLKFLKYLNTNTVMVVDENFYKTTVKIHAPNAMIHLSGSLETEDALIDTVLVAVVDTPLLKLPQTTVVVKRDFTAKEKYVKVSVDVVEPVSKSLFFQSEWYAMEDRLRASVALRTWIESLKNVEADVAYENVPTNDTAYLTAQLKHLEDRLYKLVGNYSGGTVEGELYTPTVPKPHFVFHGDLKKENDTAHHLEGELVNTVTAEKKAVSATFVSKGMVDGQPSSKMLASMKLQSRSNNEVTLVKLVKENYGLKIGVDGPAANGTLEMNFINSLNWDLRLDGDLLEESGEKGRYQVATFMNVQVNGDANLYIHAATPTKDLRDLTLKGNMWLRKEGNKIGISNELNGDRQYMNVEWKLIHMVDMFGSVVGGYQIRDYGSKDVVTKLYFKNPGRVYRNVDLGFDVDLDKEAWKFGANATIGFLNTDNIDGVFMVRLPPPDNDDHRFLISYHARSGIQDVSYVIGYNTVKAKTNYASDGTLFMGRREISGHLRASWGMLPIQSINNLFNVTIDNKEIDLRYSLFTPKFQQQETLVFVFNYDATLDTDRRLINAEVYYPASTRFGSANVSYESLVNVNGTLNAVLPMGNITQIGCQFVVFTTLQHNKRYVKVFWPQNTAILNSDYTYRSEKLDSDLDGLLHVEVPLQTRHIGHLTYGYQKRPQVTTGYSDLKYNENKVLQGRYNSKSESRAGFEKDHIQITVENSFKPIGIVYVNQYEYSAGNEGTNYPTVEYKHVNVYQLNNKTAFNVAGESRIKTLHTGREIHLKAIHSNRTVELKTDYQVLPGEFLQNSTLSLAKDVWLSYEINIVNETTEDMDHQTMLLSVSYPQREFILNGSYFIQSNSIRSFLQLDWDQQTDQPRNIGALFNWENSTYIVPQQTATIGLTHPSFFKSVFLKGRLMKRNPRDLLNADVTVDYSEDQSKVFTLSALLRDESKAPSTRKYSYKITGRHPSTKFELDLQGSVRKYENTCFEIVNNANYKRSYLAGEAGQLNSRLDVIKKEVMFQREYNEAKKYLYVRYYPSERTYVVNGSVVNTPDLNATGDFLFDPGEKLTQMMVNYTPDAVESLRMYGKIPDARYAVFNIWRTYEDDYSISDVSFYLKLNHSRLVTSTLRWRPELRGDVTNGIKNTAMDLYNSINNDVDYWKQYVKSETVNVISDVWDDAQEDLQQFLDDWNDLKELQTDFDELKTYLNNSYNANDFYIKDMVTCAIYVIDELSLRHHIESLPNILNEIWAIMGESGKAIRHLLLYVVNAVKNAFNNVSEIIAAILRGDSLTQVANIIEKLIEQYDKIVKDLHVSFIKYMEKLWRNVSQSISQQWNRFLLFIEPLFIRCIHYLETLAWKVSKEVVDFLYDRRNDLISSPYFDRFTNLTQDVDKFYRDIKSNDIVTNVQKYTGLVIQFLKDRYVMFVPFGKELKDVVDEIVTELKELQKLPSIHYAMEKMQQLLDRAYYVYDYLEIRWKLEAVARLIHSKLMDIGQSALQSENQYREAKTKFIFDPNQGLMCLEQKLPMSWHAFNQTPEFHEIPEFKAVSDIKSYFASSNVTFWSLYRYKLYMEPINWLPPFRAQAMIIGPQDFVTFDGRHVVFARPGTYLLARDFVRDTFTILIKYDLQSDQVTHKIIILMGKKAIELNIFDDSIKIMSEDSPNTLTNLKLPIELENGTTYVYQAENVITVERKQNQLRLECNLKFDLCTLELSGWYHGKTAGILGTMNNEPMDDTIDSIYKNITYGVENRGAKPKDEDDEVALFCEDLFVNRSSEFASCYDVVGPGEYHRMCELSKSKPEACTVALSYIQICTFRDTYLRIPDACTSCNMVNGSEVAEGQFKRLEGDNVPMSTDVVFIVEGKECNRGIAQNRSMEQLVTQLSKEFKDQGLANSRWSLVVFGADGVFDQPRSVIFDGQIFTKNAVRFIDYFDHVPIGNGNRDVFAAIVFATKLVFRAGVSKTFILMPCSHCEPENQTLDYTVLQEALLEHDVTLHILMDGDFEFEKERLNKIFYGLDATKSYTKKDSRTLTGDVDLRRQVKLSKNALGYCTPLSLEINGTIFSGDKLRYDKLTSVKKFVSVFSKRVALTALPNPCQNCECTANNNGVTQMECIPCIYPTSVMVDYDAFNLNDSLTALHPLNIDYGQIDIDDN
ncbi:apolipoprotein lipid transfer particle isoform X2 [Nomia melanderi]|uniref:apolipoprotein lipid transfer particle isoform X2 n=1 Tax=Nomia melanderi TaxID=2448451 RepID=UPI003FCDA207